ncbi:MAG TPA: hypothetical protein VH170_00200 [Chthoniobacterales bacterium]|jgi:hypothetical protein|nr:hypothetical protein [Chthoniobacterales bacterium]
MNVPYHAARAEGKIARALYRAALSAIVAKPVPVAREVPLEAFAYSGENGLPEQVASIRSFLRHAGRPKQFTVVSDGSYTSESIALLEKIDNCVRVRTTAPPLPVDLPDHVHSFLTNHFTGKQLTLIMSLPVNGPALYADSDVLFFPRARELADLVRTPTAPAFYLADYNFAGDERLIRHAAEKENPVNMGLLLLFQKLDWSFGLERLKLLNGNPIFFTTQTVTHLCMHANGATALDPSKFVLQADDQFIYRDRYANAPIALRHYVNPVRHKFWAALGHRFFR